MDKDIVINLPIVIVNTTYYVVRLLENDLDITPIDRCGEYRYIATSKEEIEDIKNIKKYLFKKFSYDELCKHQAFLGKYYECKYCGLIYKQKLLKPSSFCPENIKPCRRYYGRYKKQILSDRNYIEDGIFYFFQTTKGAYGTIIVRNDKEWYITYPNLKMNGIITIVKKNATVEDFILFNSENSFIQKFYYDKDKKEIIRVVGIDATNKDRKEFSISELNRLYIAFCGYREIKEKKR